MPPWIRYSIVVATLLLLPACLATKSTVQQEVQTGTDRAVKEMKDDLDGRALATSRQAQETQARQEKLLKVMEAQIKLGEQTVKALEERGEEHKNLTAELEKLRKQVDSLPALLKTPSGPAPMLVPRQSEQVPAASVESGLTKKERDGLRAKIEKELHPLCTQLDKTQVPVPARNVDQQFSTQMFKSWVKEAIDTALLQPTVEDVRKTLDEELLRLVCDRIDGGMAPKTLGEGSISKDMCLGWLKPKLDRAFSPTKK